MNIEKVNPVLTAAGAKRIVSEMNPDYESQTGIRIIHIVYAVIALAFVSPIIVAIIKSV